MAEDKNNANRSCRLLGKFCRLLQDLELIELHLHGRLYLWCNEHVHPTLEGIGCVFTFLEWCDLFPSHRMRSLSSGCSDHGPLLDHTNINSIAKKCSHLESIWPKFLGYLEAVEAGWQCQVHNADTFRMLDCKLQKMVKSLRSWS
jgi:hypothetical protein